MNLNETVAYETKLQQLLDRVPDTLDKREGSIIYDALAPIAMQLWIEESKFRQILEQAFAVTAEGDYLDLIAKDYGMERTPATRARVTLLFKGAVGAVIPQGTTVGIENSDLSFTTDSEVVIGQNGSVTVSATCKMAGKIGNVLPDTIKLLFDPIKDITSVKNTASAAGGVDQESDQSLRERILYQKRNPEHGGTISDYKRWALSVTGVSYAKAINFARGLGTVDVVIGAATDIEKVLGNVKALIDLKKPLGVDVKVRKVTPEPVLISVKVTGLDPESAKQAIYKYLQTIDVGGTIYLAKIVAAVIGAGATDAEVLEPAKNHLLGSDHSLEADVKIQ